MFILYIYVSVYVHVHIGENPTITVLRSSSDDAAGVRLALYCACVFLFVHACTRHPAEGGFEWHSARSLDPASMPCILPPIVLRVYIVYPSSQDLLEIGRDH